MSTTILPARELHGVLFDAALTAGSDPDYPHLAAVLLDCDRGEDAEGEPSDLLIATSTDDSSMAAQVHTACTGRLHRPVLISVADVKDLVRTFKRLAGTGKTATRYAQLEIVGESLVVSEDPIQTPGGVSVTVPILDLSDYPRTIPNRLQPNITTPVKVDGEIVEPTYGTGYGYGHLEIFGKIGKRRKMKVNFYRHHQRRAVVVEIGSMYHAAFIPCSPDGKGEYDEPQVSVFTPRLPVKGEDVRPLAAVR